MTTSTNTATVVMGPGTITFGDGSVQSTAYTSTSTTGTGAAVLAKSPVLLDPTITNYVETLYATTGSTIVNLSNGTIQEITTNGTTTITLPDSAAGHSFTIIVKYGNADGLIWAGGSTLKWASGSSPLPTSVTGKYDIFNFFQDGTNTYCAVFGQNY
jgi:hypothetical protein